MTPPGDPAVAEGAARLPRVAHEAAAGPGSAAVPDSSRVPDTAIDRTPALLPTVVATLPVSGHVPASTPDASPLRRHRGAILAALVVLAIGGAFALRAWFGPLVTTETVMRQDFVQTVVASGLVEAPHRLDIGAQITGTVLRVPVTEGQTVRAGDRLVELDGTELGASGRQAEAAVAQAQAKLRQLQEVQGPVAAQTLRQARATLENARMSLARSETLFGRGFIGQAALDDARKATELADAQVRTTQKQLETTGAAGSDRALAMADVAGAQASAQAARARAGYAAILAPVAGTLIARNVEVGDVVQPGRVLMTLSPRGPTQLVVQIDEKHLALLVPGQQALASADAYASERFAAELVFINPGVNATTGAVQIKLDVPQPPAVLRQDMTVSVDIEVARHPQALIVPLAAVREAQGAAPWVLRVEGRHAVRHPVRLGLRSGGLAEVLDVSPGGLAPGDRLVMSPATVTAGARVHTASAAVSPAPH